MWNEERTAELTKHYAAILALLGEDTTRDGLQKTPLRVAKSMQYLTQGYGQDPREILRSALFKEEYQQMVIVKDIELYSLCEHHLLPFYGKAHVAYIPNGYITGLSKIARVVDAFARRLQVQERLTQQILACIHETLQPLGVAVVIEAAHMCMQMRGVEKQNSVTTTSAFTGTFLRDSKTREEFIQLIKGSLSK
ncbi:MAG: GTP cyclohydrolase I FolE [Bacteroides sp.]